MCSHWPGTREELIEEQLRLAALDPAPWRFEPGARIGGVFVCFARGGTGPGHAGDPAWAAACVDGESVVVPGRAGAPYEPGLLALREGPLLEAALRALPAQPDVVVVDATGRDHPRRAGLALHLGAVLGLPTVGVTHRPLVAEGDWPADERGARSALVLEGELVGYWLRTRAGTRPLAVHAAWRTDPDTAAEVILSTSRARTPEPLRQIAPPSPRSAGRCSVTVLQPRIRRVRDEDVRAACMAHLSILVAEFGEDIPYSGGLGRGFPFRGTRVPFLNYQKGIYRAAAQSGPAALSIQTSSKSPYDDEILADGFLYAYRAGAIDQPDNRALRAAHELLVPLVYFIGTRPGWYKPVFPCYVREDDPVGRMVTVTPGALVGPLDDPAPVPLEDPIERRYAVRQTRVRLHQARFRGQVVPAYCSQCAICRLKELRLLDAAHIVGDIEELGEPSVSNGLSLCAIHHRAFDQNLVGVSPDYVVHVSRRLREDEDGPMLDLLKGSHDVPLLIPSRVADRADRERLETRFSRFLDLSA
jgi:deoxyinosine 3'endonuclease (endonuclease V)